jgi:hypothetical protein
MTAPILSGSNNKIAVIRAGQSAKSDTFRADMQLNQKFSGVQRYVIPPAILAPMAIGTNYGYNLGGEAPPTGTMSSSVQRYPFVSGAPSTNIGNMSSTRIDLASVANPTSYYTAGGSIDRLNPPTRSATDVIDRFPNTSGSVSAISAGNLSNAGLYQIGYMNGNTGYFAGGTVYPGVPAEIFSVYTHDKYPFADETISVLPASLDPAIGISVSMATMSGAAGYINADYSGSPRSLQKMPFANETFSALPTNQTETGRGGSGHQSETNGYFAGSYNSQPLLFDGPISTLPFASDTGAVATIGYIVSYPPKDFGTYSQKRYAYHSGSSSNVGGFISGGNRYSTGTTLWYDTIITFPFASTAPITITGEGTLEADNRLAIGSQS